MFVYIWENKINGMKYIGKCQDTPDSNYIGSGKYFKRAVKKYGIENFERTIIETCDNADELKDREKYWLDYYDAANSNEYYNISPNSGGGHHGADYKGKNNPMYGRKHPNHVPHHGKDNGMYGVHRFRAENPRAQKTMIVTPEGNTYIGDCLKDVCETIFGHLDHYSKMKHLIKMCKQGKKIRSDGFFHGWTGEYINE